MTSDPTDSDTDESTTNTNANASHSDSGKAKTTRRAVVAALAAGTTASIVGGQAVSGPDNASVGGGSMADPNADLRARIYEGTFAERPSAGVQGRYYHVRDPGQPEDGDLYEDTGTGWDKVDLGVGSLAADLLSIGPADLWEEDGNSPINVSGVGSTTYSIAGSHQKVLVVIEFADQTQSAGEELLMTVNGDTGANYDYRDSTGGTVVTGETSLQIGSVEGDRNYFGTFIFTRSFENALSISGSAATNGPYLVQGANANVGSPITQFTIKEPVNSTLTLRARVYGRSLNI